ncbi:MAG: YabP/YqfC family sporulation protein [Velocimicrobium sp.]
MKQKTVEIMESLSEAMKLPSDILAGAPILSMIGQRQLLVENYKGIIEYTEERIRIQTKIGRILVEGTCLNIEYYTVDDMKIIGCITMIQFCE